MKKIIQIFGGVMIAAAAVLIVIGIYSGSILPGLKDNAEKTDTAAAHPKEEYEKAVLADPVFTYTGEAAKQAETDYDVFEEIKVTDSMDGYEKTLKEAVAEGKIKILDIKVLECEEKKYEEKEIEMAEAEADIRMENDTYTGRISIKKSGIYQIKIAGMDEHNNPVKTDFLIAVNRKGA